MIGKIERVTLRDVWPHEAQDFTKWLEENMIPYYPLGCFKEPDEVEGD